MIRATMSLRGLYLYAPTIFDELVLPDTDVDRDDLIEALVLECADLEILYPQPEVLRDAIGLWSRRRLPNWAKLAETLHYEYNPIHNYDRTETHERTTGRTYSDSAEGSGSGSSTGSRNAYNSGWTDQDRAISTNSSTTERAGEQAEDEDITIRASGNIGVTTTQQMIEDERRVVEYNLTETIIDDFKRKFCLLIY